MLFLLKMGKNPKKSNLSAEFLPLQRPKSLNDLAYERLKNGILTGKLVAGEVYSELQLAKELGVSRTPVREALLKLATENLIVFQPRKGISVNYFSKKDIENFFELRQAIEEATVAKIAGNLSKDQLQTIKNIIIEQENCAKNNYDQKVFLEIDRKFHLFLIEASGNRIMAQTYNNIRDYVTITAKEAMMKKGRVNEVIYEHKAIVKALSEGNVEKANEAIKNHLITSKLAALERHIEK